jgi:hypothetical protein
MLNGNRHHTNVSVLNLSAKRQVHLLPLELTEVVGVAVPYMLEMKKTCLTPVLPTLTAVRFCCSKARAAWR